MQVELDPNTRRLRPTILFGGAPLRFLRLSVAGAAAMDEVELGHARSAAAIELTERLVDAGMASLRPRPADAAMTHTVSIVIPTYDRADQVELLVGGLLRSAPTVHEIIIVDDASPPESAGRLARLSEIDPRVRLIRHDSNLGPGAARNTGVNAASSSRVLFLDSDCEAPDAPGWIESLLGHITQDGRHRRIVAVAPRIVSARPDRCPPAAGPLTSAYDRAFCPLDMGPVGGLVGTDRRVRYVPTAALLVDLDAIRERIDIDGQLFDPQLRFGEDVDLVWRLIENGFCVVYDPSIEVTHREPTSAVGLLRRRFDYGSSAAELDSRHRGAVSHLTVSPWTVLAATGVIAGSAPAVVAVCGAQAVIFRRRLRRASLPTDRLGRSVVESTYHGVIGIGRYLNQFWWPIIFAFALQRRIPSGLRARLLVLCLGRSIDEAFRRRGSLPLRSAMTALRSVDEAAYGAGVWRGAIARRRLVVILPRVGRWKPKAE